MNVQKSHNLEELKKELKHIKWDIVEIGIVRRRGEEKIMLKS